MTVVTPLSSSSDSDIDRNIILKIFSSIGRCRFVDEKHFDACTALSGSGPAFACIFLEAMADGGVMMGLPRAEALELAAQSKPISAHSIYSSTYHNCSPPRRGKNGASRRRSSCPDQGHGHQYVHARYGQGYKLNMSQLLVAAP